MSVRLGISSAVTGIDPADIELNYKVSRMVSFGFTSHAIQKATGLTHAQIQYRVRMYGLQGKRAQFRHNETAESQKVLKMALNVPKLDKEAEIRLYEKMRDAVLTMQRSTTANRLTKPTSKAAAP